MANAHASLSQEYLISWLVHLNLSLQKRCVGVSATWWQHLKFRSKLNIFAANLNTVRAVQKLSPVSCHFWPKGFRCSRFATFNVPCAAGNRFVTLVRSSLRNFRSAPLAFWNLNAARPLKRKYEMSCACAESHSLLGVVEWTPANGAATWVRMTTWKLFPERAISRRITFFCDCCRIVELRWFRGFSAPSKQTYFVRK